MDTIYDKNSKKSDFAVKSLLPYYIREIKDTVDVSKKRKMEDDVSGLKIFPYKSDGVIRLGSLQQSGTHWYYREKNSQTPVVRSENYRIIADELFDNSTLQNFRELFGNDGAGYIGIYNNEMVISSMIEDMSRETSYSDTWWNEAENLYRLWDKKDPGERYKDACKNIDTDFILLEESLCDKKHQQLLFKYQVYKDLTQTKGFKEYVSSIGKSNYEDGMRFLKYLGVKRTAYFYENDRTGAITTDKGICDFFKKVHEQVVFPVKENGEWQYEAAELSSYIFFYLLDGANEDYYDRANRLAQSLDGRGIAVRNVNQEFVELSNDLFYVSGTYSEKMQDIFEEMAVTAENRLNRLIVDLQQEIVPSLYHMNDLSEVESYADYDFAGLKISKMDFYKWIWHFKELLHKKNSVINDVLSWYTSQGRSEVSDTSFVIDVVETAWQNGLYLGNYHFRVYSETETLFDNANAIDRILLDDENFPILFTPQNSTSFSAEGIKEHIINRVTDMLKYEGISTELYDSIKDGDFWNHIYTGPGNIAINEDDEDDTESKMYVLIECRNAKKKHGKGILVHADNEEDAIIGLGQFIHDRYRVTIPDLVTNWKESFTNIIDGISYFINKKCELHNESDLVNAIPNMADVQTFGEEKKIWIQLNEMSNALLSDKRARVYFGRDFLFSKYSGRCQLCGKRTARKNFQDAHCYTFRMVKEHENPAMFEIAANLFCVCPSCHGALQWGEFMGRDLSDIARKAKEYICIYNENVEEDLDDDEASVISMFADTKKGKEGFKAPIICNVIVNGQKREMAFSWEHFIWIAFILNEKAVLQ
jgi:hypothetical protein